MSWPARGWNPGSSHSIGYNIGSLNGSYNNFSIYGWTTGPLIEYYICEKGSVATGSVINSINSDGHTYNFYKHQQINQPSIQGTATFWQYLDNWGGTSLGANHSVTTANHINNWRSHGGQGFGSYNLQILAVEAFGNKEVETVMRRFGVNNLVLSKLLISLRPARGVTACPASGKQNIKLQPRYEAKKTLFQMLVRPRRDPLRSRIRTGDPIMPPSP